MVFVLSYWSDTMCTIGNTASSSRRFEFGVPQGSILGPLLFTLYTAPIQAIISAHITYIVCSTQMTLNST